MLAGKIKVTVLSRNESNHKAYDCFFTIFDKFSPILAHYSWVVETWLFLSLLLVQTDNKTVIIYYEQ